MIPLRSKVVKSLLGFLYLNPDQEFYTYDLCKRLRLDKGNLVKKLQELTKEGLLKDRQLGNLKLYKLNPDYPLFNEYKHIVQKTVGLEARLKAILAKTKGVEEAYLFGSYAADTMETHSDIDLLVVGSHSAITLQGKLLGLQNEIEREINPVNLDRKEFEKRKKQGDRFIKSIFNKKNIRLI